MSECTTAISYLVGTLTDKVNKTRNYTEEQGGVAEVGSSPRKSVRHIFLNTVVLLNPDVLADSSFAEVSAVHSADRLSGTLNQIASGVHCVF